MSESYYRNVMAGKFEGLTAESQPEELMFDDNGNLITPIIEKRRKTLSFSIV